MSDSEATSKRVDKPWGYEEWVETNSKYVVKRLFMKRGSQCSLQYHEQKMETVIALSGTLSVRAGDDWHQLRPFEHITLKPGVVHRMRADEEDCLYMECSTTELDDVVRLEDQYGRAASN